MSSYSEAVLQRFWQTSRYGHLQQTDASVSVAECGDRSAGLWVCFSVGARAPSSPESLATPESDALIARFLVYGDVACIACCDYLAEQLECAGVAAFPASPSVLLHALSLAEGKFRSAEVAWQAAQRALAQRGYTPIS